MRNFKKTFCIVMSIVLLGLICFQIQPMQSAKAAFGDRITVSGTEFMQAENAYGLMQRTHLGLHGMILVAILTIISGTKSFRDLQRTESMQQECGLIATVMVELL
ncbi:hypothetical protein [Petroclostridium xylanilyticum]|uniref:hypothetical protein n=1 Tax=Petroclostridium xylanilyticum TaxID=1792311 RepID=UPI000B989C66|nr:hypothetical protein [Petroclostridium xylanilyticum]